MKFFFNVVVPLATATTITVVTGSTTSDTPSTRSSTTAVQETTLFHRQIQQNGGGGNGAGTGGSSTATGTDDDFASLNSLLEGASIVFPDTFESSERVGIATLDLTITNLRCYDMQVGDVTISHEQQSMTQFLVDIGLYNLDLTCELNYTYEYGVFNGDGWLQLITDNNMAQSIISFTSPNFDRTPPDSSTVENCFADVDITRMDFEEDFASEVLEVFQGLIRGTVERAIGDVACSELSSIGTGIVANMVELAGDILEPYQGIMGEAVTDPLYLERNVDIPATINPLNLQDTDSDVGKTFNELLLLLDEYLGTSVAGQSGSGSDLAVNTLIRSVLLDDDGALVVDPNVLDIDTLLFEGHDRITQFSITLNQIKVLGLDTFTRFNPFRSIGRHTIQNELTLDKFTVDLDVTIDLKPSTLEDAILQDPTSPGISERVSVAMTVEKVDVEASILLLLDEDRLGSLDLGPFFYTANILPCVMSVVHDIQVSGLDVDPTYVTEPVLRGFESSGLDRVMTDSMHAAFDMYAGVLRDAIPNIFQTSVRELINVSFLDSLISSQSGSTCPDVNPPQGFIDFRTFFSPDGKDLYGDVPLLLKQTINDELLSVGNSSSVPSINHAVVAPITSMQSGTAGTFLVPGSLIGFLSDNVTQFGLDTFELALKDARLENLDSMGTPIAVLEPNATSGTILDNTARLGFPDKKLRMALTAMFDTTSELDETLVMSNTMDVAVEMTGSDGFMSFLAKIDAMSLYNMPLKDVTNVQCWLATVAAPVLSQTRVGDSGSGFSIESLMMSAPNMNFNVSCISCSSPSLNIIPEVLASFDDIGVSGVLANRLLALGLDLLQSNFTQQYIDNILLNAELQCPNSPMYAGPDAETKVALPEFPSLPYSSLETIAFGAAIGFEVAIIVAAAANQEFDPDKTSPLSAQATFESPNDVSLVDFTSLGESMGPWAESGLDGILSYLSETIIDPDGPNGSDLRVNNVLRSSVLNDEGKLSLRLEQETDSLGVEVGLKKLNIIGLDTISEISILDAIAPQTLQNSIRWDKLAIQLVVSLDNAPTMNGQGRALRSSDVSVTLDLEDVRLSMSAFLAMDLEQLGSLQLQSILQIENILPCLLSAAYDAELTELDVSVGSITSFAIEGFQSNDIIAASGESTRHVLTEYGPTILAAIPSIFDSTGRRIINHWINHYVFSSTPSFCKTSVEVDGSGQFFVDLRDLLWSSSTALQLGGTGLSQYGDLFRTAMGWVQNLLKPDQYTGLSSLNEVLIEPLTTEGSIVYPGDLFNGGAEVTVGALEANIGLRVFDARVDNLDTIGSPLRLFGGLVGKPYDLNNTLTLGVSEEPLSFSSKLELSFDGDDDIQINNLVDLSLEMKNASFFVSTMTKIAENRFFGFPLRDILNVNCWLATIPAPTLDTRGIRLDSEDVTAAFSDLNAFIADLVVKADCMNCSSPRMVELTTLLSATDAQEEMRDVANSLLSYVTTLMGGSYIQVIIDRLLNDASKKCPHSQNYDADFEPPVYASFEAPDANYSMHYLILLTGLMVALLVVASVVILVVRFIVRRRHKRWIMKLPAHQLKRLAVQQKDEDLLDHHLNSMTNSLFRSSAVPLVLRYGIPLILILNVGLFLSGHLSLGATVNIEAEVAGESFQTTVFEFSIARSIVEVWQAGGKEIAFLILVFSGIWPYTKLLLTMALWFLSPSRLSASRRGSILLWLDFLGKWSMVDIFVMVISIAAFRVSIQSPETSYFPDDFYSIEMMVIPLWGLYSNMAAQILSQICSSIIIHYHRKVVSNALAVINEDGNEPVAQSQRSQDTVSRADLSLTRSDLSHAALQSRSSSTTSMKKKGTMVEDLPPMATSKCIDNENFSERDVCAMPESTEVQKVVVSDSSRESDMSFEDVPMAEDVNAHSPPTTSCTTGAVPLCQHQFSRPHRGESEKLVTRGFVNRLLIVIAASMTILVVVGCTLPSFSLEMFGLVGLAVEFGQDFENAFTTHSVFSVIGLLFEQATYLGTAKDYIGLGVLSALFLSTVLIVPIVLVGVVLRQWFAKSTREQKLKQSILIEILQAWQYLEVYLVAVFVASWQLGPISDSMINRYCDNLEDMFAQLVYYGVLKEEDAQCFSVTSSVENGSFVLAAAAIALGFLSSFVSKATAQYLRDEAATQRRIQEDIKNNASFPDETSRTEDENDDSTESGFDAKIHVVPVLFTDSYRWLLRSDNQVSSSARALFAENDGGHWDLPEATAVVDETSDGTFMPGKGQDRSSSQFEKSVATASSSVPTKRDLRFRSDDSLSSVSASRMSIASGHRIPPYKSCDEDYEEEKRSYGSGVDERKPAAHSPIPSLAEYSSIGSQMESVGSSFRDEPSFRSEMDSLAYSYPSDSRSSAKALAPPALTKSSLYPTIEDTSVHSPEASTTSSHRKAPPPSSYRLSTKQRSLKKPPPTSSLSVTSSASSSHHIFEDRTVDDGISNTGIARYGKRTSLKKPPPPSSHELTDFSTSPPSPPMIRSTAAAEAAAVTPNHRNGSSSSSSPAGGPGLFASMLLQQQQEMFRTAVANDNDHGGYNNGQGMIDTTTSYGHDDYDYGYDEMSRRSLA